jgi:Mn2+/Fe2+ NRAMP family transporter
MAEATNRGDSNLAIELPSDYLPAVEYRDLPDPGGLRKYLGASVILTAIAMGSGELLFWPQITSQVGISLVMLPVLGITLQYFLNMEIARYTLVTGETAVTGFSRLWLGWGIVFVLGAILPNTLPGWAYSGAELFTFIFDLGANAAPIVTTIFLIATALLLTLSPMTYQVSEKIQAGFLAIILVFIALAIFIATDASAWAGVVTKAPSGVANLPRYLGDIGTATIFGAVVLAGAGGCSNLVQSNYIRDKGMGMGSYIPNIVSPITGKEEEAAPSLGYVPPSTEENARRFRVWWKVANQEHFMTFWFIGALLLVALSVLVFSTVGVQGNLGGLALLEEEGRILGQRVAPWFEEFFYIAGFAMLFSTSIGVIDYVARLTGDTLKVTVLRESEFWSESKLYVTVVWIMAIGGSLLIWTGIEPIILLVLSATGSGFVMAFYSVLLIVLNRRTLPDFAKLKGWRVPVMAFCGVFYILFALYLIYQIATQGPSSLLA